MDAQGGWVGGEPLYFLLQYWLWLEYAHLTTEQSAVAELMVASVPLRPQQLADRSMVELNIWVVNRS